MKLISSIYSVALLAAASFFTFTALPSFAYDLGVEKEQNDEYMVKIVRNYNQVKHFWEWALRAPNEVVPLVSKMVDDINDSNVFGLESFVDDEASLTFTESNSRVELERRIVTKDQLIKDIESGVDSFNSGVDRVKYELVINSVEVDVDQESTFVIGQLFAISDAPEVILQTRAHSSPFVKVGAEKRKVIPRRSIVDYDVRITVARQGDKYQLTKFWAYRK